MDYKRIRNANALLGPDDPPVVNVCGPVAGSAPFVLLGDHAGDAIPRGLENLGLSAAERARHIALDIGSFALGRELSQRLEAPFVSQAYSRLVIDCNRSPSRADAIAPVSDGTVIPGNQWLDDAGRAARIDEVHEAYHSAIADLLDKRAGRSRRDVVVSVHSFTPVFGGQARPWQIGVLHDGNAYSRRIMAGLRELGHYEIGDNEPYRFDDTDYTIPRHALARGMDWVELEIRQDMLASPDNIETMAAMLTNVLADALPR